MKRKPSKKIKRYPALKIVRTPVPKDSGPLILSKKEPADNIEDFKKEMRESRKRAKKLLAKDISTEAGFIQNLTETNLESTKLYYYQINFMNDRAKYRHGDKSRQIGMSYGFSCEGYGKTQLFDIYTGLFISFNQEEANEKITYARALDESVSFKYKKKIVVDRVTAMEWEGKLKDGRKTRTRLISHPQREPRGKGYNTDVFLDEIAHYQWPEKIYVAAVPIITRGFGQLAMASSPLGQSGLHYAIGTNVEDYPNYSRHRIYWWNNPDFLNDYALENFDSVHEEALLLETKDRVFKFGNDSIVEAYNSMLEEYFQQEYELKAIDESVSYYPMELIKQCTFDALMGLSHIDEDDLYGDNPIYDSPVYTGVEFKTYLTIEELSRAIAKNIVTKRLIAGYDVGRTENSSEIIILEEIPGLNYLQIVRLVISLKNVNYKKQFDMIEKLFNRVPIKLLKIDSTGLGDNLAEDLKRRFRSRIEDVKFTNPNKGELAINLKLRFEDQIIAIPNNRDLIRQIHSIKRKVMENALIKYEVDASEKRKHHGDMFWALALASSAGEPAQMYRVRLINTKLVSPILSKRILSGIPSRTFNKIPMIGGISDYKKLPPPPNHYNDFTLPIHKEFLN